MLNFLLRTRQKRFYRIQAHWQRHEKHVSLRQPARAVAGMQPTVNGDNTMEMQVTSLRIDSGA